MKVENKRRLLHYYLVTVKLSLTCVSRMDMLFKRTRYVTRMTENSVEKTVELSPIHCTWHLTLCITHSVFWDRCQAYLTATMQSLNVRRPHLGQRLRSTSSTDFSLPQLRTKFGERAFSHAIPAAWNSLPEHIRAEPDISAFRKLHAAKTHILA